MKKILSLFLSLCMVFTLCSTALAVEKPQKNHNELYKDVGQEMITLGIMNGYSDGKLHLDNQITRAEFVAMIIRALGYDYLLGSVENKFTDVSDNYWAKEYIAVANALGYVNGIGGGKFSPDSNVTIVQAQAIILRILGYGNLAQNLGWPNGYSVYGMRTGLSNNVYSYNSTPATRGEVAQMISNALTINFYDEYARKGTDKNILTENFNYKSISGKITDIALTDTDLEYNKIRIGSKTYNVHGTISVSVLEENMTGYVDSKNNLVYFKIDSSENVCGYVQGITSSKIKINDGEYKFASDISVYLNGSKSSVLSIENGMLVKVIMNEKGYVDELYAFSFDKAGIKIESIKNNYIDVSGAPSGSNTYNIKNKNVIVIKDGNIFGIDALNKGDMVSVYSNSKAIIFYISDYQEISGVLNFISSKGIKIDSRTYDFSNKMTYSINNNDTIKDVNNISDLSQMLGLNVKAVLDNSGKITHIYSKYADDNMATGIVVNKYFTDKQYIEIYNIENSTYERYYYSNNTNRYNKNGVSYDDLNKFDGTAFSFVKIEYSGSKIGSISEIDKTDIGIVEKLGSRYVTIGGKNYYINGDCPVIDVSNGKSDFSITKWNKISNSSTTNDVKFILSIDKDTLMVNYVFVMSGYEYIGKDYEYGTIISSGANLAGDFFEVDTKNGLKTITVERDVKNSFAIGDFISWRENVNGYAIDIKKMNTMNDKIAYIIDYEYIDLETLGDYYQINRDTMVIDKTVMGDYDDQKTDIYSLRKGQAINYVINNENKVVYIEILNN